MIVQSQIVSLLNEALNQTARLRKGGTQAVYFCKCGHYKRKLEVSLENFIFHCWVCNERGTLSKLLRFFGAPPIYRERLFKLTGDLRLARRDKKTVVPGEVSLPAEFHPLSQPKKCPEYRNALAYLKRRGILREDILRYNIGYCDNGPYGQHIIVPSYDAKGKLNFFMGRRYYNDDPGIPHKKPNVPMDLVGFESFLNYGEPINLCEGVFDAMAIRINAVPLFGKYPSKTLRERMIVNKVKRVNIVLDDDAFDDAVKNYKLLTSNIPNIEIHIVMLNGKDPSTLGFEKVHKLIRESRQFDEEDLFNYEIG